VTQTTPQPGVSVVIATRGRPEMLRDAVRAVMAQQYDGPIETVIVYDQVAIDSLQDVPVPPGRTLRTINNSRAAGLAGGRNTGIHEASHGLVAFCDDDDEWMPEKLARQIALWHEHPGASLIATGMRVQTTGRSFVRLPPARVEFPDLIVSRITEMHPSSFLLERSRLLGDVGLVDESIPASYGEDYDLLLRASRLGPVMTVPEPLVVVHWNRTSFFSERWEGIAAGLSYLLSKHPEFNHSDTGSARLEGQIAFAFAALGDRPAARRWASAAIRHDRSQLRAYAAYGIAARLLPAALLVRLVNRGGRGL
jgi:glycosyltransferase involved in cell wall biosynthesis